MDRGGWRAAVLGVAEESDVTEATEPACRSLLLSPPVRVGATVSPEGTSSFVAAALSAISSVNTQADASSRLA